MEKEKEAIQRKLRVAKLQFETRTKDLEVLISKLKPLELEHEKLLHEIKYLKDRIEKLIKMSEG